MSEGKKAKLTSFRQYMAFFPDKRYHYECQDASTRNASQRENMVRPSVVAASAANRHRQGSPIYHLGQTSQIQAGRSATQAQDYGTIRSNNQRSIGPSGLSNMFRNSSSEPPEHDRSLSDSTVLPKSKSYHGLIQRAERSPTSFHSQDTYLSEGSPLPSYRTFRLTHLLVDMPVSLLILLIFILLAMFGWPVKESPYPHRLHISKIILGAITWIASEALRLRLFRFLGSFQHRIISSTAFLLFLHTVVQESLRLYAVSLLYHQHLQLPPQTSYSVPRLPTGPPRPPKGFFRAFDLALGFAGAEIIWRTLELLGSLKMYEDVLSPESARAWLVGEENVLQAGASSNSKSFVEDEVRSVSDTSEPDVEIMQTVAEPLPAANNTMSAEDEYQMIIRDRKRLEFEESFGCALWEIPVFIVAVWRLDATLLHLALTLLLSLPFHNDKDDRFPRRHPALPVQLPLLPTFIAVILLHWLLSLGWTLGIKFRRFGLGMPAISYGTLLLVLSCFFASLAVWSALV